MNNSNSIRHVWSVLCQKSVIDTETNNLSLYDILEELNIDIEFKGNEPRSIDLVNVPFKYEVVSLWENNGKQNSLDGAEIDVDFINPEGKILKEFKNILEVPKLKARMRTRLKIDGIGVSGEGAYMFNIKIKEKGQNTYKTVAKLPLTVKIKTKQANLVL